MTRACDQSARGQPGQAAFHLGVQRGPAGEAVLAGHRQLGRRQRYPVRESTDPGQGRWLAVSGCTKQLASLAAEVLFGTSQWAYWVTDFEAAPKQRRADGDSDRARGAALDAAIVRSLQQFRPGESGDGASLAAKASLGGDESWARGVRLFIGEEQNHARLLAALLTAVNARLISSHWSDAVFIRLRRALGIRLEPMVLFAAEFSAELPLGAPRRGREPASGGGSGADPGR
jgi:hypothetical protein